jgi:hypothetical protein
VKQYLATYLGMLVIGTWSTPARAEPAAPADPELEALTTSTFYRGQPIDLHWHLLNLPGALLEVATVPVAVIVTQTERNRLDKRVADLLDLYDGRIKLSPRFKLSFGDGIGIGLKVKFPKLLESRAKFELGGIYRLDGDWLLDTKAAYQLGSLERRSIRIRGALERDANQRYYGIGGGTEKAARRALRDDEEGAFVAIDLFGSTTLDWSGELEVGGYRETLAPGIDPMEVPLGMAGDTTLPPPGFGTSTSFGHVAVTAQFDTRDTRGRPTRGTLLDLSVVGRSDLSASSLSGVTVSASYQRFLPVFPEARVLVLTAGGEAAAPVFSGTDIPLSSYPTLGRNHFLRGYDRDRFIDRYAVWTSLEYRYPIYEYKSTEVGLDAIVFTDGGTAFGEDSLSSSNLRYSAGGGIRGAHETTLLFELTVGYSPEGIQFFIGSEKKL